MVVVVGNGGGVAHEILAQKVQPTRRKRNKNNQEAKNETDLNAKKYGYSAMCCRCYRIELLRT